MTTCRGARSTAGDTWSRAGRRRAAWDASRHCACAWQQHAQACKPQLTRRIHPNHNRMSCTVRSTPSQRPCPAKPSSECSFVSPCPQIAGPAQGTPQPPTAPRPPVGRDEAWREVGSCYKVICHDGRAANSQVDAHPHSSRGAAPMQPTHDPAHCAPCCSHRGNNRAHVSRPAGLVEPGEGALHNAHSQGRHACNQRRQQCRAQVSRAGSGWKQRHRATHAWEEPCSMSPAGSCVGGHPSLPHPQPQSYPTYHR